MSVRIPCQTIVIEKCVALRASVRKQERQNKNNKPKDNGSEKVMKIKLNISKRKKNKHTQKNTQNVR